MSFAKNDTYNIYINNTLIGTGYFIEIYESAESPHNLYLAYDGGDGAEIVLQIRMEFITVDLDKKEIYLKDIKKEAEINEHK